MQVRLKTPISYYGGKQQLSSVILSLLPSHKAYNEPFFGGGAIFFAKRPCEREYINDLNGAMINFYSVLKHNFAELKEMIDDTLYSEQNIMRLRGCITRDVMTRCVGLGLYSFFRICRCSQL